MSSAAHLADELRRLTGEDASGVGIVIVDHGSKRTESNDLLFEVVKLFRRLTGLSNVEPAHMELASPTIAEAFDHAVEAGARRVVVLPYFLGPGRHWSEDIPRLAAEAAARHEGVPHTVAAPLGLHAALTDVLAERVLDSLRD